MLLRSGKIVQEVLDNIGSRGEACRAVSRLAAAMEQKTD
jgi:hypothetical protein